VSQQKKTDRYNNNRLVDLRDEKSVSWDDYHGDLKFKK